MEEAADRLVVFLVPHLYLTVFAVSAIDAIGIPFPGRILLVLAGAFAATRVELAIAIAASALGSLVGDHVVFLAGARGGERLLALYCLPPLRPLRPCRLAGVRHVVGRPR